MKLCRGSAAAKPGPRDLCHTLPFFYPQAVHIDLCDSSAAEFFFDSRMMGPKIRRPPLLRLKSFLRSSSRPEHLDVENPSFDPAVVLNRPSAPAVRAALFGARPQYSHTDNIPSSLCFDDKADRPVPYLSKPVSRFSCFVANRPLSTRPSDCVRATKPGSARKKNHSPRTALWSSFSVEVARDPPPSVNPPK